MRGRKLVYETVADMCAALKELSFQAYRFQDCLAAIVSSAFGSDGEKGLMQKRTAYYMSTSPLEWAKQADEIYELLGPSSFLLRKISDCANNQMPIEPVILSKCITDQFPKAGSYQSRFLNGLRREATGSYSIRLWEWFWLHFLRSFLGMQIEERRLTPQEDAAQDDFFGSIIRNPFLGLLLRSLTHLQGQLKGRLVNLIHLLLVQQLLFKFKSKEEVAYRLRPHYLHLLYLMILTTDPQEETIKTYYLYLQKVAQNYSATTVLSHNHNIRSLIRVWLTIVTRLASPEIALVRKLPLANDKDGWFRLARCPIDQYQQAIANVRVAGREIGRANAAREAIVRLLEKNGQWQPTYGMLAVIEQLLTFQLRRRGQLQRDAQEEGGIISKAIQRNLVSLLDHNSRQTVSSAYQRLSKRIEQLYGRGLTFNIDEKMLDKTAVRHSFKAGIERKRLMGGDCPKQVNVWAYPLQQNEFLLLYRLTYWLAEQADHLLPGERGEHPRINLRILSNPLVFAVLVALIVAFVRYAL